MRLSTVCTVLATASCFFALNAQAQVLGSLTVAPTAVKAGEPVTIKATIDVISANYCGFVVGFGDGTFKDGVSDASNATPLVLTHTYAKGGSYHVTLGGRNVQNHHNCSGQEKAVDVAVTDAPTAQAMPPKADQWCTAPWKVKTSNAKTHAYTCSAKRGTALPAARAACYGELSYFENAKKGQYGCKP